MQIRILGCSGGIGANLRTTSILVDQDILIDCGTGIGDLSIEQMKNIQHIFITHSHLDHTVSLPLLVDTIFGNVDHPLKVYASEATIQAVKQHIFNWVMWPDFTELPTKENPSIIFEAIESGQVVELDGRKIKAVDVNHVVPCYSYVVTSPQGGVFVFSGDTKSNNTLWPALNDCNQVDVFILEAAFEDELQELADIAGHYCPKTLAQDLHKLDHDCDIFITHLKPGSEELIMQQLQDQIEDRNVFRLMGNEHFEL
ncbi:MAG: 3',5'-cyclic-nucleotide phosphodiesterase [Gammaproteobacteria bacterium]|nr:3',5'-cyclic-nucleotide phosphodiesterase [Gammaproteobacteria bacterium]NNM14404.1 3',5'-cyclic-nucleotide phosphodiesterase [Gammaproteobacteria bacterium]